MGTVEKYRRIVSLVRLREGILDLFKRSPEKIKKQADEVYSGFVMGVDGINEMSAHHPIPESTIEKWEELLEKELEKDKMRGWHEGYNFFSDHFNHWISTPDGKKWNEEQAAKSPGRK